MHLYQSSTTLLLPSIFLFLAHPALAIGSAHVINNCPSPVYFASVADGSFPSMQLVPASGYSEPFTKPGVGVSIKFSTAPNDPVAQFEYTWTTGDGKVSYDISNIDGSPFAQAGVSLVPSLKSSSKFPSCVPVNCPPGQSCAAAYNHPNDVATKVCPDDTSLIFTLCTVGKTVGSVSPSVSASVGVSTNAAVIEASTAVKIQDGTKATNAVGSVGGGVNVSTGVVKNNLQAAPMMQTKVSTKTKANVQTMMTKTTSRGSVPASNSVAKTAKASISTAVGK